MNWKQSLNSYLTNPPNDGYFDNWYDAKQCAAIIERAFSFYNHKTIKNG